MTAQIAVDAPAIEVRDLAVRYAKAAPAPAFQCRTLDVPAGQWVALLGPNGSGKSSFLRALATLSTPSAGSVRLFGHDPSRGGASLLDARRHLGVIFQQPSLDELLTVEENLLIAAAAHDIPNPRDRLRDIAVQLGIADRIGDRVGQLSGGLIRRADLARALLARPRLLLLDEPTTGLDLGSRAAFLDQLDTAHRQHGLTIMFATHQMDEAERAQRVLLIDRGSIVADDTPQALRSTLGASCLRIDPEAVHLVKDALPTPLPDGAYPLDLQSPVVIQTLIDAGARFTVGPATLGDVYLSLTGRALEREP